MGIHDQENPQLSLDPFSRKREGSGDKTIDQ